MLYQISNGCVQFGAEPVLEKINFEIRSTEKIAVVGRNGCGKTTLLRLVAGEVELTRHDNDAPGTGIFRSGQPTIGYLKQVAFENEDITLEEEIRKVFAPLLQVRDRMERALEEVEADPSEDNVRRYTALQERFQDLGGYQYDKEYNMVCRRFGFTGEDLGRRVAEFSGGQRSKIAFIKLLLSRPDIMLLDEPTNHLDMSTVEWLEQYLKNYPRAVVVVSHDRMFLDRVADVVYEIEYGRTRRYPGNYTHFSQVKKADYEKQRKDYIAQQSEIKRLETLVERFKGKPTKVSMARSKQKAIEHMEKIEDPAAADTKSFKGSLVPVRETGHDVLSVSHLKVGYDHVLAELNFELKKGEKLAVIGDNGTGKSTLMKTLVGRIPSLGGEYHYGVNVEVGYFDQEFAQYASDKDVLDDFWDMFPTLTMTEARSALGAFLFSQDDVYKQVSVLSGGEKARLALCKIFQRRPNVLILDEPTNHMDIIGKETLEELLNRYSGTVLFVSHDRYFVKNVADKVLLLTTEGMKLYPFGYEQYAEEQEKERAAALEQLRGGQETRAKQMPGGAAAPYGQRTGQASGAQTGPASGFTIVAPATGRKETARASARSSSNPGKERARITRKIEKQEERISLTETEIAALKAQWSDPALASDYKKLQELQEQIEALETRLEEQMEEYLLLTEELEGLP